ncbi:MAG: CoA-disulfide reductase [Alphaproteobacteria bacterium]|nr:CoA-disulfide reductase [Alphaproteobacteria bacterium]
MKVIIIGAQGGGMTAAARLKRNLPSAEVIVYDSIDYVSFGACGLPYYIGNFFDNEKNLFARTVEELQNTGLKIFIKHRVLSVDEKAQTLTVKNLENGQKKVENYDKLIIASGATPRDFEICNNTNTFTVKTLYDAHAIKDKIAKGEVKSVSILGAGFIGLELLEAFKNIPSVDTINIIDFKHSLTSNILDDDFEEALEKELRKHNINIYLKAHVEKIDNTGKGVQINAHTNNHNTDAHHESFTIQSDILIVSKGFVPNTHFLDNITFKKLPNGALLVDREGRTNIANIYAIGDCASVYHKIIKHDVYIPLATIANKMARVAADSIAGIPSKFTGSIGSSMLKVLDVELGKTGLTEYEAKKHNIPYNKTFVEDYNHTNYYPGNARVFMKVLTNPDTGVIIGGQILGKNGTVLRIHALSAAVEKGLTVEELGMLDFAYAPPFTRTWEALNILGNVASAKKKV